MLSDNFRIRLVNTMTDRYMCPCCFAIHEIEAPEFMMPGMVRINCKSASEMEHFEAIRPIVRMEMVVSSPCHPNADYMIPIDNEIADAVSMMNRKGYYTEFSCQGHYNGTMGDFCDFWGIVVKHDIYRMLRIHLRQWNHSHPDQMIITEQLTEGDPRKSNFQLYPMVKSPVTDEIKQTFDLTEFEPQEYDDAHDNAIRTLYKFVESIPDMTATGSFLYSLISSLM